MKQIIQDLKTGQTLLEEVPSPQVKSGAVLIRTTHSLVSLGTERMLVEFGKAGLIEKARQQPDRVKQVLDKGHKNQFRLLVESIQKGGKPIIPFDEIVNTTKASFAAIQSLKENRLSSPSHPVTLKLINWIDKPETLNRAAGELGAAKL